MKRTILSIVLLVCFQFINAQSSAIEKGWEYFNNNEMEDAISQFESATTNEQTKEEAFLTLSLIYEEIHDSKKARENFMNFYKSSKNPYPYVYAMWYNDAMLMGNEPNKKILAFYKEVLEILEQMDL